MRRICSPRPGRTPALHRGLTSATRFSHGKTARWETSSRRLGRVSRLSFSRIGQARPFRRGRVRSPTPGSPAGQPGWGGTVREGLTQSQEQQEIDLGASEVLNVATVGGARALALAEQIGELKAGMQADFAVVSLDGPHQVPGYDPVSTLIFASSGRDVILTVVAGREVYRDGRVTTVDEDRLRARMKEIAEKLAS